MKPKSMRKISLADPILPAVDAVVKCLSEGGLVVAPSDTVYGLLADATNRVAVEKLLRFKNRPPGKPVSVFVADMKALKKQISIQEGSENMLKSLLPGPFTVILDSKHKIEPKLESERGTIGIRIPIYEFINEVSRKFGKPITATSANISGKKPHYRLTSLLSQLSDVKLGLLDLVVDAGQLPRNKPSTVIDLTSPEIKILRKGDLVLGKGESFLSTSVKDTHKIAAHFIDRYILKYQKINKPLIFLFEGEMGAGKTAFIQGMGKKIKIENIVSPTYVVSYEYDIREKNILYNKFVHYDLFNLIEFNEFDHIGIREYLDNKNILAIEWSQKISPIIEVVKKSGILISVKIEHRTPEERYIKIAEIVE